MKTDSGGLFTKKFTWGYNMKKRGLEVYLIWNFRRNEKLKSYCSKNLNNSHRNQVKSCQDCQERAEAKANLNQNFEWSPYLL